jgi:hypothetical protein
MCVAAGLAAWRCAWRRLASLVTILIFAWPVLWGSTIGSDYTRRLLALPTPLAWFYAADMAAAPAACAFQDRHGTPIEISRHDSGFGGGGILEALICDSTGQLAAQVGSCRPPENRHAAWSAVHLGGPFYIVNLAIDADERWLREARDC